MLEFVIFDWVVLGLGEIEVVVIVLSVNFVDVLVVFGWYFIFEGY